VLTGMFKEMGVRDNEKMRREGEDKKYRKKR
jgi:hypothetical protein